MTKTEYSTMMSPSIPNTTRKETCICIKGYIGECGNYKLGEKYVYDSVVSDELVYVIFGEDRMETFSRHIKFSDYFQTLVEYRSGKLDNILK